MMRRLVLALVAVTVSLAALQGALAQPAKPVADPGVTPTSILIGGTAPLTGQAAAYASVARGAEAYFKWVSSHGGVNKREIVYEYLDDAYEPAKTIDVVRKLVEEDKVFAVFNTLGTEANLGVRDYLNGRGVPQLFVASGATTFGADAKRYPWTIGFQPSYRAEGWVYGQYLRKTRKSGKVAVLFQNDDYGKDLLASLKSSLAGSKVTVIAAESYEVTSSDISSQVAKLKSSGADIFAIFATPRFVLQAFEFARRLNWRPLVINNAVGAATSIMQISWGNGLNKSVEGTISTASYKDPASARWKNDPGMKLYRSIMKSYAKDANPGDGFHLYGMAVAYQTVDLLQRFGKAVPTRAGLMQRARSMQTVKNPFLLPGIIVKTGPTDGFPLNQMQLQRWTKGAWQPVGGLWTYKGQ